jgi:hypothetical protein
MLPASCLDLNATRNHTPSAQLNQPRLLQKARRYRHRLRLAGSSSNAPGLPPHITPTDGSWLNLIERWFELLRNIRIGGAHVGDKVERALKGFTEATDDTLLATNPKRLSGRNPRTRFWPACPALPALQSKFTALHLCKTTMTHHSKTLLITPRLPSFVVCEYRFTLRAASQEEYIGIQDKPYLRLALAGWPGATNQGCRTAYWPAN